MRQRHLVRQPYSQDSLIFRGILIIWGSSIMWDSLILWGKLIQRVISLILWGCFILWGQSSYYEVYLKFVLVRPAILQLHIWFLTLAYGSSQACLRCLWLFPCLPYSWPIPGNNWSNQEIPGFDQEYFDTIALTIFGVYLKKRKMIIQVKQK